jgi:hypothetical protein
MKWHSSSDKLKERSLFLRSLFLSRKLPLRKLQLRNLLLRLHLPLPKRSLLKSGPNMIRMAVAH